MDDVYGCAQTRPLLAELATGAVTGQERAAVLRHVAACPPCRSELAELTKAVDALLLLTPVAEPPPGFESAVVARIGRDPRPARHRVWVARQRRMAGLVAAVVIAAALGAGAVWLRTADDRALADQTRHTLAEADGRYLQVARLTTDAGTTVGTVFMYEGNPSWLLVSVSSAPADGAYEVRLVHGDGISYTIGACQIAGGSGTTSYRLNAQVTSVVLVQLTGPRGVHLTART